MKNMGERFSATKLTLASFVLAVAIGSGIRINKFIKYENPLNQIRNNITSSQLAPEEKREYLGILNNINLKNPQKELRNFMHLSLAEKRDAIYNPTPRKALNYLHENGIIDKNNLSHGACLYLENISLTRAKGMLLSQ